MSNPTPSPAPCLPWTQHYRYLHDLDRITHLWLAHRAATGVRAYPTLWRVRLLLTSRVWEPTQDTRVWEHPSGQFAGLAMLWRRHPENPYLVLDRFIHPRHATGDLAAAMLQWGCQRAAAIAAQQKIPLTLFTGALPPAICPDDPLASFGFTPLPLNPAEHNVYFSRSLQGDLPTPALAPGCTIRPLHGIDELQAYQDLYSFTAVDPHHQRELLASDEYSHLVAVDPQGQIAAYCECSICWAEWELSAEWQFSPGRSTNPERLGWIDYIETRPEQQRQGFGHTILLAGLARLRGWGAHTAMLVTVSANTPAISLYQKTGFARLAVSENPTYKKRIEPQTQTKQ